MRNAFLGGLSALSFVLSAAPAQAALDCIQGNVSAEALDGWRAEAAQALQSGALSEAEVSAKIKECFGDQVPSCLQRTADYTVRNDIASSQFDEKFDQSPQKRPPAELLTPGATGLDYTIPENVEQLAAEKGWPTVRYKSRHAGGFDPGTPSLLMIYVPGDKVNPPVTFDRWLNIPIPADEGDLALAPTPQMPLPSAQDYMNEMVGAAFLPKTFTMVTLERKNGASPGKVYFQMFRRAQNGDPRFSPQGNSSVTSCYSCHPNGLRAISPLGYHVRAGEQALAPKEWFAVQLINDAMIDAAGNKVVSWRDAVVDQETGAKKPLLNPASQGPILGAVKPLNATGRTEEFIKSCTTKRQTVSVVDIFGRAPGLNNVYKLSEQPDVDWEKVRDAMKCASCHNDKLRGAFNTRTDLSQIDFKILVDQSMPLGAHVNPLEQDETGTAEVVDELSGDERIALANCLREEFQLEKKELVKWLTQTACQTQPTP